MSLDVLVEPRPDGSGYRASTGFPLGVTATGPTAEDAVAAVGRLVADRLQDGARIVTLPGPPDISRNLAHAGPPVPTEERRLWREGVDEYRRQCDEELRRQYGPTDPLVKE